jgi:hypothetical protein
LKRLDPVVLVLVSAAVASTALLTYRFVQAEGLSLESARSEVVRIERGDLGAFVTLTDGAHKPHLTYRGQLALEYSDWSSRVEVDGDSRSLWDMRFRVEVWDDDDEIVHTRHTPGYEIVEVTRLEDDHAEVAYFVSPRGLEPIEEIELTISHYKWYFQSVDPTDDGAVLRSETEPRTVWFRRSGSGPIDVLEDDVGPHAFTTEYHVENIRPGELTLVAQEEIWFQEPNG